MSLTIVITGNLQQQGVQAAANAYNTANPNQYKTAEEYLRMIVEGACTSYAAQFRVGVISSGDYVLRFTPAENAAITTAAETDSTIAVLLSRVRESAEVVLHAPEVTNGVAYLVAQSLLTQERADAILAYSVPISPAQPE